jgi:hypothetical protein
MPYNPGLGQGHGKKRHLHAHSPVNFKELKCYQNSNVKTQMFPNSPEIPGRGGTRKQMNVKAQSSKHLTSISIFDIW